MVVLGTNGNDLYKVVLVAHIFCAIVGFGAVYLNALYGKEVQKRPGAEGIAVFDANHRVSKVGEYFIYAVFVLGLALVGLSDPVFTFSQTWVWLAIVLYLISLGLSHGVLFPSLKRMRVLMSEMVTAGPPPGRAAAAGRGDAGARQASRCDRRHPRRDGRRDPRAHGVQARLLSARFERRAVR